jgi:hypothetical protein
VCFSFDPFCRWIFVARISRKVLECRTVCDRADGPWAHHGWSVIEGAVLEVQGSFSDGPP